MYKEKILLKCLRNFNELKIDNSVTLLYEENEVYKIYKDFLSNPYGMQKILFEE